MKRIYKLLLTTCILTAALFAASVTAYAANENTVLLFDASEQENGQVKIDVNVVENTGVYAMLLTLDYDASALTLTDVEYGEAFASLEPLASESYSTYPYRISYLGSEKKNDTSTGRMMTLTFAVNENVSDGEYTVKFLYKRNGDVSYLTDGQIQTKNLVVNGAKLTLKGNTIDEIVTVPDNGEDLADGNGETLPGTSSGSEEPSENKGAVIGIIVACSVVGAGGIALIAVLIVKKKKRKWIKV